jgi:hypothetical protein
MCTAFDVLGVAFEGTNGFCIAELLTLCFLAGAWEADLQQGLGKCKWADGSSYDGLWQQGNRWGG